MRRRVFCNFRRIRKTPRMTPEIACGMSGRLRSTEDVIYLGQGM
jgi:hypothetical protein